MAAAQQVQSLDDEQVQNVDDVEKAKQSFFKKHKRKIIAALVAGAVVAGGVFYLTSVNTQGRAWCKKNMPWAVFDTGREGREIQRMSNLAEKKDRTKEEHLELFNLCQKYSDQIDNMMFDKNFVSYVKNRNGGLRWDAGKLPKKLIAQNERIYDLGAGDSGSLGHTRTQEESKELYRLLFESGREGDLVEDLYPNEEDEIFRDYLKGLSGLKRDAGL